MKNQMKYSGCNVLLPEASGRQLLPMAKAFSKLGCHVTTVQEHKLDLGNVTRFADEKKIIEQIDTDKNIAEKYYTELINKNKYDLIVPLSDFSADIFANIKNHQNLQYNTYIATNFLDVFLCAYDKLKTMKICMDNNIPCPYTLDKILSIDDVPKDVNFPVIVKPRSSCGSIGMHIADSRNELETYINTLLKEYSSGILVQEFIPQNGRQYNAHFFIDNDYNVKTALLTEKCRWFPIDGGAGTLCRTIHNEKIMDNCKRLLKIIGWIGYCDIDLMEDPRDGSVRIIEINARISANVKICFAAGVNIAEQIIQLAKNEEVTLYSEYKDDIRLKCIHTDLLWFIKSKSRFNAEPPVFNFKNTKDQIWSIDDPLPFFAFSIQSLLKYKREMKKRKR